MKVTDFYEHAARLSGAVLDYQKTNNPKTLSYAGRIAFRMMQECDRIKVRREKGYILPQGLRML